MQPVSVRFSSFRLRPDPLRELMQQRKQAQANGAASEPFFVSATSTSTKRLGLFKRTWNRFVGLFRKEDQVQQDAKLTQLLEEMTTRIQQGKVTVWRHKATSDWAEGWESKPYGPSHLSFGERNYTIRMKRRLKDWIYDIYKEQWTLKSDDGRFQITYTHRMRYSILGKQFQSGSLQYKDKDLGVTLSSDSSELARQAMTLFEEIGRMLKEHQETRFDVIKKGLSDKDKLAF